jgi:hypothetical protein
VLEKPGPIPVALGLSSRPGGKDPLGRSFGALVRGRRERLGRPPGVQ